MLFARFFFAKNLHMSKKSSTFAPDLKNNIINTLKNHTYGNKKSLQFNKIRTQLFKVN